jgi:Mrp family chromosome partitioning ATPase
MKGPVQVDLAAIVHRLDVTRARVESEVAAPAVIAITSAARGDGKSLVATGLAYGLAGVGHSVLLVDGNADTADRTSVASAPKLDVLPFDVLRYVTTATRGEPARLGLFGPGVVASASFDVVRATFARLRSSFAYTIIDTAVLLESGMALVLASESDAVVIAFKQGRAALEADREFVKALRSAKTPVLGVVTTHAAAIRAFKTRQEAMSSTNGLRLRSVDDTEAPSSLRVGLP